APARPASVQRLAMPSAAPRAADTTPAVGHAPATTPAPVAMPIARSAPPVPPAPPASSAAPAPPAPARTYRAAAAPPVQRSPQGASPPPGSPPPPPSARWQSGSSPESSWTAEQKAQRKAEVADPLHMSEFQLDQLSRQIIGRVARLLRTELRLDRERIGKLRDNRY
ncbi:hypothetical protein ACFC1B_16265, partial [Streptomyces xiamenensis]